MVSGHHSMTNGGAGQVTLDEYSNGPLPTLPSE